MQGTAGVALAGLLGTVRSQGRPLTDLANQKIVIVGAGSAGLGVLNTALPAAARMAGPVAKPYFFLLDKDVKKVKPHVLLGLSGCGGIFKEEVLKAMRESNSIKPAIFAMSNPTMNAKCTAVDAFKYAGENIVFASGSPFENVDLGLAWELLYVVRVQFLMECCKQLLNAWLHI